MKFRLAIFPALFILVGVLSVHAVQAEEVVKSFDVAAELKSDRELTITETIRYDFDTAEKHGIYRTIPEKYERDGAFYRLRLQVLEATMDGAPVEMRVSRWGSEVNIRLGSADETITGVHNYVVRYRTSRAINDFPADGEAELYWNVTGNAWNVPIEKASFHLTGPASATKYVCYTGLYGSSALDCAISSEGNVVTARTTAEMLYSGEGLTVAVRYPEQSIVALTFWDKVWILFTDNIFFGLPLLVFLIMFFIWRARGRDPKGQGTIIAQYEEPRGLRPAQMAALKSEHVPPRAISATLLDLARRGYLKIRWDSLKSDPGFKLIKLKDADGGMLLFEKKMFAALFEDSDTVRSDENNAAFAKGIQESREVIFQELKDQKFYDNSPTKARAKWTILAMIVGMGSFFLIALYGFWYAVAGFVSGIVIAIFGWFMPRASGEGAIVREEIEGFKLFLSVTEKDRLAFHNSPARRPEQFERFLPSAVAFGVEKQWAEHFKDIQLAPPSYMEGPIASWNSLAFVSVIDSWHSQSASSMYAAPSRAGSGGSGFSGGGSGGGFGGGGGGSW